MEGYLRDVKKLSLICVLSTSITEGSLLSGSIFSDIRTSLYSRMLEVIKQKWEPLNLYKYLSPGVMPTLFMDWVFEQMKKYQDKDFYLTPSYTNTIENDIYKYMLEPQYAENQFLYYNLSYPQVIYILQRLPKDTIFFPCRYSIYVERNIDNLIKKEKT